MFRYEAERWTPRYILNDKNGYALAKAIEGAMNYLNEHVLAGVLCAGDYDTMPEWRLDELAWEINCLFDYAAPVDVKRKWIKSAFPMYRLYGTPAAVYQYIGSYFNDIDLEEWWEYRAEPFHFRLTVEGEWTPENEAWARKALDAAKNARSVLDGLRIGTKIFVAMTAEGEVLARFYYPMTGPENWAGRWPQENVIGVIDRSGNIAYSVDDIPHHFPYPEAGTRPEINTLGALGTAEAGLNGEAIAHPFTYDKTAQDRMTGTVPRENTVGILDESGKAALSVEDRGHKFPYTETGTQPEINVQGATSEAEAGLRADVLATLYEWPHTGTQPEINTLGAKDETAAGVSAEAAGTRFPYPAAGTQPEINTLGIPGENDIHAAQADDTYTPIPYKMCGADEI